jgi:hypothetical protein
VTGTLTSLTLTRIGEPGPPCPLSEVFFCSCPEGAGSCPAGAAGALLELLELVELLVPAAGGAGACAPRLRTHKTANVPASFRYNMYG